MDMKVDRLRAERSQTKAAPGRPQKSANGDDARERILDAAENLFAHHGLDAVSVRDVARKAHVDTALVHYYFATKRGVFDAVFQRRAAILNKERIAMIDAYEAAPGPGGVTVEGLIEAFLTSAVRRVGQRRAEVEGLFRAHRAGEQQPGLGRRDDGALLRSGHPASDRGASARAAGARAMKICSGAITSCRAP